jgi:hypothetical protein
MPKFPNREEFEAWLKSIPEDHVVASDWDEFTCPLMKFGNNIETLAIHAVYPSSEYYPYWFDGNISHPLPEWANLFALGVDEFNSHEPVFAKECLNILEKIGR